MEVNQFYNKEELHKHIEILWHYCDFKNNKVAVHLNLKREDDYPRMSFTLFTLSRAYSNGFVDDEDGDKKRSLLLLFWSIYDASGKVLNENDMLYVLLYGMRFLKNFGEDYNKLINDFENRKYGSIYAYPVCAYVYMSTYIECEVLRAKYPFSNEIFLQCKKMFDFLLYSNLRESSPPFHFSEMSLHTQYVEQHLVEKVDKVIRQKFENGYLGNSIATSGVTKCMEDFARRGEDELLKKCFSFLEKRSMSKYEKYMNPDQEKRMKYLYVENDLSQYVCLDTNAHLVHTYINLYEKSK